MVNLRENFLRASLSFRDFLTIAKIYSREMGIAKVIAKIYSREMGIAKVIVIELR